MSPRRSADDSSARASIAAQSATFWSLFAPPDLARPGFSTDQFGGLPLHSERVEVFDLWNGSPSGSRPAHPIGRPFWRRWGDRDGRALWRRCSTKCASAELCSRMRAACTLPPGWGDPRRIRCGSRASAYPRSWGQLIEAHWQRLPTTSPFATCSFRSFGTGQEPHTVPPAAWPGRWPGSSRKQRSPKRTAEASRSRERDRRSERAYAFDRRSPITPSRSVRGLGGEIAAPTHRSANLFFSRRSGSTVTFERRRTSLPR